MQDIQSLITEIEIIMSILVETSLFKHEQINTRTYGKTSLIP